MAVYTFDELTYAVIYSDDGYVQYNEMSSGSALETDHVVELFTEEAAAKARAEELGYVFVDPTPPPPLPIPTEPVNTDGR